MSRGRLDVAVAETADVVVLTVWGVLDATTYVSLRDAIIAAAVRDPTAVIVDVSALSVPSPSAWTVFTSAWWHVSAWREAAILAVSAQESHRAAIAASGLIQSAWVYPGLGEALTAAADKPARPPRRRASTELPPTVSSVHRARQLSRSWLTACSKTDFIPTAQVVSTVLVENAVRHAHGDAVFAVEAHTDTVIVAVSDSSAVPAAVHDSGHIRYGTAGLEILSAVCRAWGSAPTGSGKTVWAVIGTENRL